MFGSINRILRYYCKTTGEYGGKLFGYYDLIPGLAMNTDKTICACDELRNAEELLLSFEKFSKEYFNSLNNSESRNLSG
jgi:hypothetical protein